MENNGDDKREVKHAAEFLVSSYDLLVMNVWRAESNNPKMSRNVNADISWLMALCGEHKQTIISRPSNQA